ncbi:alpha-galactosidase, partial [Candidatus Nomurabacteria bacterium]|nr:alpha-galactosidase [Candidatus Nomurabacteria bacterium]
MKPNIIADHEFGDMSAIYYEKDGQTSLMIIPAEMRDDVKEAKLLITESLVQAHVDGDKWVAPYSRGISMRNTETSMELRFTWQEVIEIDGVKTVITYLDDPRGRRAVHRLTYSNGGFFKVETSFVNTGSEPFELMMLSSFSLTGISPFVDGQAENSLFLHRFRSYWSAEGRHIKESIEDLGLEPSWSNWATKCEKFYQTGSMPIRKFFPICGIEDIESGVTWAAELEWAGSWQIEPYRRNAAMCLSGGLADKDTGGWSVVLNPGEEFTSIPSCITVVKGSINDACDRLLENSRVDYNNVPESEYELPVIYNEYCDTWGNPTRDKI